jgi:Arc/MetJ family transcription regulator
MQKDRLMGSRLILDDALIAKAREITGIADDSTLITEALRALIEREAARRLARLGGSQPQLRPVPRRRPTASK